MRTLSIAWELRKRNCRVQYLLADETSLAWLRRLERMHSGKEAEAAEGKAVEGKAAEERTAEEKASEEEKSEAGMAEAGTGGEKFPAAVLGIPYGNPKAELPLLEELLQKARHPQTGRSNRASQTDPANPAKRVYGESCRQESLPLPDWILVDSYAVDELWLRSLRSMGVPTVYIDDEMRFIPPAELVVNYDPDAEVLRSHYGFGGDDASLRERQHTAEREAAQTAKTLPADFLLGPSYAPLRPQFTQITPVVRTDVKRVFLSTGGTDPYGMAGVLEKLVQSLSLEAVVMAPGYPCLTRVAEAMQSCDLAVAAAGTTLYELCAAGVPTLAYAMADNQTVFAGAMEAAGVMRCLGDIRGQREQILCATVTEWIKERINKKEGYALRCRESKRMHELTDGRGACRIADALLQITAQKGNRDGRK